MINEKGVLIFAPGEIKAGFYENDDLKELLIHCKDGNIYISDLYFNNIYGILLLING